MQIEKRSTPVVTEEQAVKWAQEAPELDERGVSVPQLTRQLNLKTNEVHIPRVMEVKAVNVYREVYEGSFDILPEDAFARDLDYALEFQEREASGLLVPKQRAAVAYSRFTDAEKLSLLKTKLEIINEALYRQSEINKVDKSKIQLRDFVEAAIAGLQEKGVVEDLQGLFKEEKEASIVDVETLLTQQSERGEPKESDGDDDEEEEELEDYDPSVPSLEEKEEKDEKGDSDTTEEEAAEEDSEDEDKDKKKKGEKADSDSD
eukprot:Platyproteum_vivax@DN13161_c0_g1_i2.p1